MKGQHTMSIKKPMLLAILICGLILGSLIGGSIPLNKFTVPLLFISPLVLAISFKIREISECNWKGQIVLICVSIGVLVLAYGAIYFFHEFANSVFAKYTTITNQK
ncbi:hypothetical protein P4W17_24480 [Bacillus thuringiensis]|nr:hypothetical protein bthur0004_60800 [Bacillus thuringiensis serovar sotto str. T04001]MED2103301.1 hypothetical protein [Bacillus thuringiensis]MED2153574.1 hypothetical protein [Bacillus thuringiensis]MED2366814.1 hypothetical protein [Bacillus thuringiensis]MED2403775.1 hypothetical protein [Bacillus thuringiensis]